MTYSSATMVSRRRFATRHQNAVSFNREARKLGPISNTVLLLVMSCLLGLLYLTQVTKTNASGYVIDDLQKQQASLQSEHDDLELSSARLQSIDRIAKSKQNNTLASLSPADTIQ